MNTLITTLILALAITLTTLRSTALRIPAVWNKDFRIYVYSGGGMINESTQSTFTFDSCVYVKKVGDVKTTRAVALSAEQRSTILNQLRQFKLDEVRSRKTGLTMDKGSTDICLYEGAEEQCLSDNATSKIEPQDFPKFSPAFNYLMEYTNTKKPVHD